MPEEIPKSTRWRFYPQQPTDPIHNPISGEFFSTEAVGNVTEALIREGVQNTLDARKKKMDGSQQPANIRIFLSETAGALPAIRARRWFGTLWPHVMAPANGLRNQPATEESCPFLVLEDFGTIGLAGDYREHKVLDGVTNHFLNFFRAEGHSDKGGQDRGSWGVGKTVFPRASRLSSYIGLTVRSDDDKKLLLGRSILKYHCLKGRSYKSDGYFGLQRPDGLMLPIDDPVTLAEFSSDFRIKRKGESGLSIVVPWYEMNGDDGVKRHNVIEAVLRGFFYPILMGHLSVTVATPAEETALDSDTMIRSVEAIGGDLATELLPTMRLAEWAQTRTPPDFQSLIAPPVDRAQKWSVDLVPTDVADHIRQSLAQRHRVALKVPMSVQPRSNGPHSTFFNVFLEHTQEDRSKPVFIRDELIISDVKSPRVPQVRSLVIVEDAPLATLLRDAETPAHTQWNQGTSKFKDKYKFGPGAIKFVRLGVSEIVRVVNQSEQQPDRSITIDFFSVPIPPDGDDAVTARRREPRNLPGGRPTPPPPPLPPKPRRFRIDRLRGGFAIRSGDSDSTPPSFIDIRVAYDVGRGNPLRKYHPADFDLGHSAIRHATETSGVALKYAKANRMLVAVEHRGFNLEVTGFDPDRDLYVKAEVKETADVD
jgi:hypothetical protein